MANEVWYAVYLYANGRWTRDRSFSSDQHDQALDAAKAAPGATGAVSAALVEETNDPETKTTDEEVIFATPRKAGVPDLAAVMAEAKKKKSKQAPRRKQPARPVSGLPGPSRGPHTMTAIIFAVSVLVPTTYVMAKFAGSDLLGFVGSQSLVLLSLVGVLVAVLIAARVAVRRFGLLPTRGMESPPPPAPRAALAHAAAPSPLPAKAPMAPTPEPLPAPAAPAAAPSKAAAEKPRPEKPVAPELVEARAAVVGLMARCLGFLSISGSRFWRDGKIDPQAQLGHDLFLIGAADAAAEMPASVAQSRELIAACLDAAGRLVERAADLSRNHEGYLLDPRNLDIFRAGREAMITSLRDEALLAKAAAGTIKPEEELRVRGERRTDIGMFLENSLDTWVAKGGAAGGALQFGGGTVTAVVTGAPTPAVALPGVDETNQRVLAGLHDRMVRDAIAAFGGTEIKRMPPSTATADRVGMLVAFSETARAVEAAVAMQRAAAFYSRANPDLPLQLSIGIAAGRPVMGRDGLIGSPVPEAAQLCIRALPGQILAAKLVPSQASGGSLKFRESSGPASLNGTNKTFVEVDWSEEGAVAVPAPPPIGVPPPPAAARTSGTGPAF